MRDGNPVLGGLEVRDVVKTFGRRKVRANDGLSLSVAPGEVVGLLGPNGAGKTTLVRQVLGLARPDSGSIVINGTDVVENPRAAHESCTYAPQTPLPMSGLKPRRAIELTAQLRGTSRSDSKRRSLAVLERLELHDIGNRPMQDVSGGTARLIAFAMAVARPGHVVVLDEPTNDVDPLRRRILWEMVREVADGGATVLLVTHNVHEAERTVDRVVIVNNGRVVGAGRPDELIAASKGATLEDVYVDTVRAIA